MSSSFFQLLIFLYFFELLNLSLLLCTFFFSLFCSFPSFLTFYLCFSFSPLVRYLFWCLQIFVHFFFIFLQSVTFNNFFSTFTCAANHMRDWRLSWLLLRFVMLLSEFGLICIHLSLILFAGHSLHQAISLFSAFFLNKEPFFFPSVFFLISLLQLFFNFFMAENHFFTLFCFPWFYYHVSCPFFLPSCFVKGIWWQRTKHVIKRNEWRQRWEWSPRSEKEVSCWRVFEHDWRSELMDQNQPRRMRRLIIFCKIWQQWCVSCGWLPCVWHRPPLVKACHHLLMFSLSTFVLLMFIQDGQLEAVKLNQEDSTVCVEDQRKIVEKQLSDAALVNNE